jgi:four helix bundle protein
MSSQIFRSGTSIGANIREAQNAESKADFIHKFKIAAKEADEIEYWLKLCRQSPFYPDPNEEVYRELNSIIRIVSKIISSSKKNKLSNFSNQ